LRLQFVCARACPYLLLLWFVLSRQVGTSLE
jgi:hypothetical protein